MAAGDRIPLVSQQEFTQLEEVVKADTTGLVARVNELETNGSGGLLPYDTNRQYKKDQCITRNGNIYQANQDTSGAFNNLHWTKIAERTIMDPLVLAQTSDGISSGRMTLSVTGNRMIGEMENQQVANNPRVKRSFEFDGDKGMFKYSSPLYSSHPVDNEVPSIGYVRNNFVSVGYQVYNAGAISKDLNALVSLTGRHRVDMPATNAPVGFNTKHAGYPYFHTYCENVTDSSSGTNVYYKLQVLIGFNPIAIYQRMVRVVSNAYDATQDEPVWIKLATTEDILVNEEDFVLDKTKNRLSQKAAPTEVASDDKDLLS